MDNLEKAKKLLNLEELTCVLVKGDITYKSTDRGVAPMMGFISNNTDLQGFSAADKVIGKAAAMLFVLAKVKEVYAPVISEGALKLLLKNSIKAHYDMSVETIINRDKTGSCPMEIAVKDIDEPKMALEAIRDMMAKLKNT